MFWNMTRWKRPCCSPAARLTISAARPKKVRPPVKQTIASSSPRRTIEPMKTVSSADRVTGSDSPVSAAWSTSSGLPGPSLLSAGTMSPNFRLMRSPGTRSLASIVVKRPSRLTEALGARDFFKAEIASPALRSSK